MKSYHRLLLASRLRITILPILVFGFLLIIVLHGVVLVRANSEDTNIIFSPARNVTRTSTITETEPSIAISPISSDLLVTGMNTSDGKMAAYLSVDGGELWQGGPLSHFSSRNGQFQSDPVVAFDTNGRAYIVGVSLNRIDCENQPNIIGPPGGIYIMRGDVSGATLSWLEPIFVHYHQEDRWSLDKPWLAIDTVESSPYRNRIYVAWTNFFADGRTSIQFSYSDDGANSFPITHYDLIAMVESDSSIDSDRGVQAANIAVGPTGDVYVAWVEGPSGEHPEVVERALFLRHSSDGGDSFGPAVKIVDVGNPGILATEGSHCGELRRVLNGGIRISTFPFLATDPTNPNRLYVVWNGANKSGGGDSEIYLAFSDDKGSTWSSSVLVNNDSTNDQFMPGIAVDGQGTVFVEWYDRKSDPENLQFVPTGSFSRPGTLIFEQESLIAGEGFSGRAVGDYLQIAALPEGAAAIWVGDNDSHVSVARYIQNSYAAFLITQSENPVVSPGETTTLALTLRNGGTVTWEPDSFALMLNDGDGFGLANRQLVPSPISPNQDITWNLSFSAPQEPGIYNTHWQMAYQNDTGELETFGPVISYYVIVTPEDGSSSLNDWLRLILGYLELELPDWGFLENWLQQIESLIQAGIEILLQLVFGIFFVIALLIALPFIISTITNS